MSQDNKSLQRQTPPFRADHVGSFLRPERIKQARAGLLEGKVTPTELKLIEDEEISLVVQAQKDAGIQAITDGEFRRAWWHTDFMEHLAGVEGYESEVGYSFHGVTTKAYNVRIVDKIDFHADHPFIKDFEFLQSVVGVDGRHVAKQTIPSPNMFMHTIIRNNPVYKNLDEYAQDLAKAYRKAIQAFYDAGCRYLQLDDVFWAYLSDAKSKEREAATGSSVDQTIELCSEIIKMSLQDKPKDMVVTMHVCRGNFSSAWIYQGGYNPVAKVMGALPVDGFFLEYDDDRSGDFEPLKHYETQQIVLGLITSKAPELEEAQKIKNRIQEATQYVPLERLALSPQCGFASTEEGNKLTEEQQWAKLKHVVKISHDVWG